MVVAVLWTGFWLSHQLQQQHHDLEHPYSQQILLDLYSLLLHSLGFQLLQEKVQTAVTEKS